MFLLYVYLSAKDTGTNLTIFNSLFTFVKGKGDGQNKTTTRGSQGGLVVILVVIYRASHHCEPGFNSGLGQHVG